ncbi:MAG: antitoxin [Flammeovirgaceae bacterium]|nr:antitoxin [Flammeovirgaceae bacterium]MBE63790.1 antitoxin [Flammeovirgaceae bacterium]MBR08435.1 antitoxin [Rickettsiales bacterium]HCX24471.1 antitoxin [Cytophagales bacterium]|tara:strand:+ start:424 stop:669 length:246 start_codon:yes stop_codon:yes gene_type:complete
MSRLVIDVSSEQHQKIKALASLQGKSIKDYVLDKILTDEESAMEELSTFLSKRIESGKKNQSGEKSFEDLTEEIIQSKKNQ